LCRAAELLSSGTNARGREISSATGFPQIVDFLEENLGLPTPFLVAEVIRGGTFDYRLASLAQSV
jgi:hypothetical protein